jgi:hypothetical protein
MKSMVVPRIGRSSYFVLKSKDHCGGVCNRFGHAPRISCCMKYAITYDAMYRYRYRWLGHVPYYSTLVSSMSSGDWGCDGILRTAGWKCHFPSVLILLSSAWALSYSYKYLMPVPTHFRKYSCALAVSPIIISLDPI